MEKTIKEPYWGKEQLKERIKELEKNVMDLKVENVLSKKTISVKEEELKRLNELRHRDRLEYGTHGKAIKRYNQEVKNLKDQLSQGQNWFMKLVVPMLTTAVTNLMDKIYDINEDVIFPKVTRDYYKEGTTGLEFPWDRRQILESERLATEYSESSRRKEIPIAKLEYPPVDSPLLKQSVLIFLNKTKKRVQCMNLQEQACLILLH
ncbi:hypothetical protein M9H77_18815 [Catharanthus roseus]|uniref:Uncharacterized protein n=1 Tax=Catharanthus roseus TaxID=4058 RepID=A0ACC0B8P1_CATRO|nr:hypothetical protein M9H77_18815 [Catharanthus roseus]